MGNKNLEDDLSYFLEDILVIILQDKLEDKQVKKETAKKQKEEVFIKKTELIKPPFFSDDELENKKRDNCLWNLKRQFVKYEMDSFFKAYLTKKILGLDAKHLINKAETIFHKPCTAEEEYEAIFYLRHAYLLEPKNPFVCYKIAQNLIHKNYYEDGLLYLLKAVSLDKDNKLSPDDISELLSKAGLKNVSLSPNQKSKEKISMIKNQENNFLGELLNNEAIYNEMVMSVETEIVNGISTYSYHLDEEKCKKRINTLEKEISDIILDGMKLHQPHSIEMLYWLHQFDSLYFHIRRQPSTKEVINSIIENINNQLKYDSKNSELWENLGNWYFYLKDYHNAEMSYENGIKQDKENAALHLRLGCVHKYLQKYVLSYLDYSFAKLFLLRKLKIDAQKSKYL